MFRGVTDLFIYTVILASH